MKKLFKREIKSLEQIFRFLNDFRINVSITDRILHEIELGVEEVFTNLVKYNPSNVNEIQIELEKINKSLIIKIIDFDVEPFDLLNAPPYNTAKNLEDRPIGGVGIHLTKKFIDDIEYHYENRRGVQTHTCRI